MTTRTKKKDDELLVLSIVGGLFTLFLIGFDLWYSSISEMSVIAQVVIWGAQIVLAALWVVVFAKWKDPNYDYIRKPVCYVALILAIVVGVHHGVTREDNQVIIDSKENAVKP